jgi:tRNA-2-methylthio-N6-dimethylallyladenosine synthase
MAECDAVCEHIHLPLQSGSTRILKAMRRTYSRERYLKLAERLREAIPDLALGTDIIVGFPGETGGGLRGDPCRRRGGALRQRLHVHLLAATGHRRGDDGRPGFRGCEARTARAARGGRPADRGGAQCRAHRARREVLVEGQSRTDETLLRGRTRRNTTVVFTGSAQAGDLVDVAIDGSTSTTLRGSVATAVRA